MKTGRIYRDPYSPEEIRVLVEDYEELCGLRSKSWVQVRLMDLDRAYAALGPVEKKAVLLCGFLGLTVRECEAILDTDFVKIHRQYMRGLDYLARHLNGGL